MESVIYLALLLIVFYVLYSQKMANESFGYPKWMLFYPPHVRTSRTGLKYYNKPYTTNLRMQYPSGQTVSSINNVPVSVRL